MATLLGISEQTIYVWRRQNLIDTGQMPGVPSHEQAETENARAPTQGTPDRAPSTRRAWRSVRASWVSVIGYHGLSSLSDGVTSTGPSRPGRNGARSTPRTTTGRPQALPHAARSLGTEIHTSGITAARCVHNASRSQMGAALLPHPGGGQVEVRSAGSAPAEAVNPGGAGCVFHA